MHIGKRGLTMVVGGISGKHAHVAAMFLRLYSIVSSTPSREEHRLTRSPENVSQFIDTRPNTGQRKASGQVVLQMGSRWRHKACVPFVVEAVIRVPTGVE